MSEYEMNFSSHAAAHLFLPSLLSPALSHTWHHLIGNMQSHSMGNSQSAEKAVHPQCPHTLQRGEKVLLSWADLRFKTKCWCLAHSKGGQGKKRRRGKRNIAFLTAKLCLRCYILMQVFSLLHIGISTPSIGYRSLKY